MYAANIQDPTRLFVQLVNMLALRAFNAMLAQHHAEEILLH